MYCSSPKIYVRISFFFFFWVWCSEAYIGGLTKLGSRTIQGLNPKPLIKGETLTSAPQSMLVCKDRFNAKSYNDLSDTL